MKRLAMFRYCDRPAGAASVVVRHVRFSPDDTPMPVPVRAGAGASRFGEPVPCRPRAVPRVGSSGGLVVKERCASRGRGAVEPRQHETQSTLDSCCTSTLRHVARRNQAQST